MNVAIWDTYILREDKKIMHFDILVPEEITDTETVLNYGKTYLKEKPFVKGKISTDECTFCHIETINTQEKKRIYNDISTHGFAIIELENCN